LAFARNNRVLRYKMAATKRRRPPRITEQSFNK
jgi:hypothetical protein